MLAAQRARQISGGADLTIDRDRDKNPVVALREIAEETVKPKHLEEAIVGNLPSDDTSEEADIVRREDGSLLVDGLLAIDKLKEAIGLAELPDEESGAYQTVSGLVMTTLGRVPKTADHFDWQGYRFEVVDMDRNRVDKLLIVPPAAERQPE